MITRQQLRQFLAVVDCGTFTRAAESIGVTQPSLSSAIRELENDLGATLFDRQRPYVRLTSAGNRLLPVARRITQEFLRAERETSQSTPPHRPYIVGTIPSFPTALLATACRNWGSHPLTVIERNGDRLRKELMKGQIDAAMVVRKLSEPDSLHFIDLFEDRYLMILPADHLLAGRREIDAGELGNEVMIARRSCEVLSDTSDHFTLRGIRPRFSFKSLNDDRAIALVAAGLGITLGPASLLRDGVVGVRLADFPARRQLSLAVRRDDFDLGGDYVASSNRLADCFKQTIESAREPST